MSLLRDTSKENCDQFMSSLRVAKKKKKTYPFMSFVKEAKRKLFSIHAF